MASGSPKVNHTTDKGPETPFWHRLLTGVATIFIVGLTVMVAILLALQDLPTGIQVPSPVAQFTVTPIPSPINTFTPQFVDAPTSTPFAIEPTSTPIMPETPTTEAGPPVVTPLPPLPPPTVPVCIPPSGWVPYTARPGDTLVSLAYRYRTSVSQLMYANCLTSQVLYAGQIVYVPSVIVTPTPRPPCGPPFNWVQYIVQPGDTLYSLSTRTRTTVYAIVQANCLTGYTIYVGQQLWLPSLPPPPPTATWPASPTPSATPEGDTPTPTSTLVIPPTETLTVVPGDTPTPTSTTVPGDTPTSVPTSLPSDTPTPTATLTVPPTALPPSPTPPIPTSTPPPTPTLPPAPTSPPPTNTPVPFPTDAGG